MIADKTLGCIARQSWLSSSSYLNTNMGSKSFIFMLDFKSPHMQLCFVFAFIKNISNITVRKQRNYNICD